MRDISGIRTRDIDASLYLDFPLKVSIVVSSIDDDSGADKDSPKESTPKLPSITNGNVL